MVVFFLLVIFQVLEDIFVFLFVLLEIHSHQSFGPV